MLFEEIIIYGSVLLLVLVVLWFYIRLQKKTSKKTAEKIEIAKQVGLHEPVSLHPVIDLGTCIKSGACVEACPEKDIIGIVHGRASLVNAAECVGHGACFHACPVEAISLVIGTEKRGVDLPHVSENFETNVPGIYIAGELGGMGLIKNSVEQGEQAMNSIAQTLTKKGGDPTGAVTYDVVIIGAGPAGISASLTAKRHGLNFLTVEQDSLGGTVFNFPRSKIVMTAPVELPLHGKVKLFDTSKKELLDLWNEALSKNGITIREHTKVEGIQMDGDIFRVMTAKGEEFKTKNVLLAIGRRGSPRKLGVPGEGLEKVAYRLLEPELVIGKNVVVVGGGDSAIEAALSLVVQNSVVLSYRSDAFSRVKPKNREKLEAAIAAGKIDVKLKSNVVKIDKELVELAETGGTQALKNDLVYIFAGGELPTQFLQKTGVEIKKRFGYTVKKHR
ncbi:MAG: NAD(P)-binding domain-containing protein [Saprospiraceae bacterium]|nr:NAD(P)-binding domain-containing protein [Saprospiraceae bacterium]MCF8250358.1 NAD(P)-binding domain-containing protein [Saprospiraceae bacterium]MCF8280405.1 NAD(P)-binding domain-containing protein [Bacteroidales bacterium]MCF8312166.1 NAD(P)-binding domain-containing protein [Saprospiraceae bacterium]MCF8441870.1 NAD(P)-binding domain-containing protein [Saprospiraceae bacterium]